LITPSPQKGASVTTGIDASGAPASARSFADTAHVQKRMLKVDRRREDFLRKDVCMANPTFDETVHRYVPSLQTILGETPDLKVPWPTLITQELLSASDFLVVFC
jgi:hypothetical protein